MPSGEVIVKWRFIFLCAEPRWRFKLSKLNFWGQRQQGVMKKIMENQAVSGIPMPLSYYINLGIGSRASFNRWEKGGLNVLRVGRCVFVDPAELSRFIHGQKGTQS